MTFPTILFLIFLVLKLAGYIHWSWWFVFAPLMTWPIAALIFWVWFVVGNAILRRRQ